MEERCAFTLVNQETWQNLLHKSEQIFARCLEQTEAWLFTKLPDNILPNDTLQSLGLQDLCIAFKPHRMHSTALPKLPKLSKLSKGADPSMEAAIHKLYTKLMPELPNELPNEAGLIQRLDYETAGLLLQAPNQELQRHLQKLQKAQKIRKFYLAWSPCSPNHALQLPQIVENYFAPYGPRGSQVRICKQSHKKAVFCQTKIEACLPQKNKQNGCFFLVSLQKGFRHQVRAQLAQLGFPLCSEPLYSNLSSKLYPRLGLIACGFEICGQRLTLSV